MSRISFQNIDFSYRNFNTSSTLSLFNNISLTFNMHEHIGIIGKSGAGKSTLLQLVAGFLRPSAGEILIDGKPMKSKEQLFAYQHQIGFVFQFPESQFVETTVFRDVAFALKNQNMPHAEIERRVPEALENVGLRAEKFLHRRVDSLSQGEQRRVAIAGILVMEPRLIILDEPTAGLDETGKFGIVALLAQLKNNSTIGFMIASHDYLFLEQVTDSILILEDGQISPVYGENVQKFWYEKNHKFYEESFFTRLGQAGIDNKHAAEILKKAKSQKGQPVSM